MRMLLTGALLCAASAASATEIPLDHFVKHAQFVDVKISPTGEYLAASVLATEDTGALIVLGTADQKMRGNFKLRGKTFVSDFDWVNDTRLVFSVAKSEGSKSTPRGTGELFAMDADGRNQALLIGPEAGGGNYRIGWMVDDLVDDDKFVLIETRGVGTDEGDWTVLEKMHVNTGKRSVVARSPVINGSFLVDHEGRARLAWGTTTDNRQKVHYRSAEGGDWKLVNDEAESNRTITPLGFDRENRRVLVRQSEPEGPDGLYAWNPADDSRELLARDDDTDPLGLLWSFDRRNPYGVYFMDGLPRSQVLDAEAPEAKLRAMLAQGFPGRWISISSYTRDGNQVVFQAWSDRDPGQFYLFDRKTKKATFLLATRSWLDPEALATMKPIEYKARDGLVIDGYLTLPPGREPKKLPLILNPHGGPLGPFDAWGFNQEVQLFANRGYAVLQVNFRGSGHYGNAFETAGWREWGGKMIDDMTDGVKWAIAQGIADPERICIYGASYGGYAALQAPIREPGLYQCAVGYVGVYDMQAMYTYGDVPDTDSGQNFLAERMGGGREFVQKYSPARNADKVDVPVFLIVGNDDIRAHPKHSRLMRDALKDAGKEVEWLEKDYEGHGYFKEENNRELYTKMLAFFEKHLGNGAAPAPASP